jgi:hypothetical protein
MPNSGMISSASLFQVDALRGRGSPLPSLLVGRPGSLLQIGSPNTACFVERVSPATICQPGDPVGTIMDLTTGVTYAATSDGARGTYRQEPSGGAVHQLIIGNERVSNTTFWPRNTGLFNVFDNYNGEAGESFIRPVSGQGFFSSGVPLLNLTKAASAVTYTISAEFKAEQAASMAWVRLQFQGSVSTDQTRVFVNLNDGTIGSNVTAGNFPAPGTYTATTLPDGWLRVVGTLTTNADPLLSIRFYGYEAVSPSFVQWTGDGTGGMLIRKVQLVAGSVELPYQTAQNANQFTQVGKRPLFLIRANGVSTAYTSAANVNFSGSDRLFVAVAGRKTVDQFGHLAANPIAPTASWRVLVSSAGNQTSMTRGTGDTTQQTVIAPNAPDIGVFDTRFWNGGTTNADQLRIARNGVVGTGTSTTSPTSPGNFDNQVIQMAHRGGAGFVSFDYNGLFIRGGDVTEAERAIVLRELARNLEVAISV